ncbi:helix-turn-helix domain-containing protein [Marinomonas sp. TI.3.20]|uniref:helix-turn-helix domain-containing protein n=1 Tax=Marinomonas sp. TI.3.20 TaxID=3121296 RepID=UPI00311DDAC8
MINHLNYISDHISISDEFEDVFSHCYYAANNTCNIVTKTLLPSFQTMLILNFGESILFEIDKETRVVVDKFLFFGPIKKAFKYHLPVNSEILVITFKDDAFYRFFGLTLDTSSLISTTENINDNCFNVLWCDLKKQTTTTERLDSIFAFCRPYLKARTLLSKLLLENTERTFDKVKLIAKQQNKTERTIQMHHRKHFGFSVKENSRYVRFKKAITLIQNSIMINAKVDWFDIIIKCGYYDQSHLIHDFKNYLNLTPTQYIQLQNEICNPNN